MTFSVCLECCHPFGFLSEAVRMHNPIVSWAPLVASSRASHIRAGHSGLPLCSWNSASIPAPDIYCQYSTLSAFCWHSHARVLSTRRSTLGDRGFGTCVEHVPSRAEDCTFPVVVWQWLGDRDCTAQYNSYCCLSATNDCRRFCPFVFLV